MMSKFLQWLQDDILNFLRLGVYLNSALVILDGVTFLVTGQLYYFILMLFAFVGIAVCWGYIVTVGGKL